MRRPRVLTRLLHPGEAGDAGRAGPRRIAGQIGLRSTSNALALVVGVVTTPLLARTLGVGSYGVWTTALAYVGLFGAVTEFGLMNSATLKMAAEPQHERQWLEALFSLRTLIGVGSALLCAAGIPLLLSGSTVHMTALILVPTIVFAGANTLMAVFQSRLRAGIPVVLTIVQSLLWLAIVLALAAGDPGPVTVAVAYAAMLGVMAAVQVRIARRLASVRWRGVRARWRALLEIALPLGLSGFFITVYYKADAVLLYELGNAHEAGVYGVAYRFLDPLVLMPALVMSTLFPVMSAIHDSDRPRVRRLVQRCAEWMALISLPVVAGSIALADPVVDVLFGDEFARSATVLPILTSAFVAICFGNLAGFVAPIVGLRWRITVYSAIGALANVALNVALIPEYGAVGSAWATTVTEALATGLLLVTVLRRLEMRLAVGRIARTAVAALAAGAASAAAASVGLIPGLVVAVAVYVAAVFALGVVSVEELRSLRSREQA